MGFDCELTEKTQLIYKIKVNNGLIEHEYLHVWVGRYDKDPVINKDEATDFKWISVDDLRKELAENGDAYSYWPKVTLDKII